MNEWIIALHLAEIVLPGGLSDYYNNPRGGGGGIANTNALQSYKTNGEIWRNMLEISSIIKGASLGCLCLVSRFLLSPFFFFIFSISTIDFIC